jgi:prepilin-type processing-associated H-X9-DG protein
LIELLVVIAIIAILAAILFPVFAQAREKARQTACLSNMKQFGQAFAMYTQDYDETYPDLNISAFTGTGVSAPGWLVVIQPYVENLKNINERGKDINTPNAEDGRAQMSKCPSHFPDARAGFSGTGAARASSGGASLSYGMADWAAGAFRPVAEFKAPADTILLAENFLNFTQMVFYPVSWDENQVSTTAQGYSDGSDCRFDKSTDCTLGGTTYPRRTDIMPGVTGTFGSNLATRHNNGSNYLLCDGHAKWFKPSQTYKPDGSFSMWTVSGRWFRKP